MYPWSSIKMIKSIHDQQLKVFGYGLSLLLFLVAWREYHCHGSPFIFYAAVVLGLLMAVLTGVKSSALQWFYIRWMVVAAFLGMIVTALILTVLFVLIFIPTAICLKCLGKDYMRRNWQDRSVKSFWLKLPQSDDKNFQ